MNNNNKLILVGVISSAHGVKGHVLIKSFTSPKDNIFNINILDKDVKEINIKKIGSNSKNHFICEVEGCNDRNQAEIMKSTELYCYREDLPKLEQDDEFYIEDLKNLPVVDKDNNKIGKVLNIVNFGAGDILEILFLNDNKKELLPFSKNLFPTIEKDYIVISDPNFRIN